MKKLLICGNFGAANLGDEAILDGIIMLARLADPTVEITAMSADPVATADQHKVNSVNFMPCGIRSLFKGLFSGGIGKTLSAIKNCDGVILGGGGLFTDEKLMAIFIWSLQNLFFRHYKKPVFCLGQSVGPLNTFFGKKMTKGVYEHARLATVRDTASQKLLHSLNLPLYSVLADPAFIVHSMEFVSKTRENYIVLSVRPWIKGNSDSLYKILAQLIEWIYSEYGLKTVLLPFQLSPDNDLDVMNKILENVGHSHADVARPTAVAAPIAEIFEYTSDYKKAIELISKSKAVIGMRLHSMIFSVLTETPFLALSYSNKTTAFMEDLELSEYCLDWENLTLGDLKERFGELMKNYDGVFMKLNEKQLIMRAKAREHEKFLRTFFGMKSF